MIVVGGYVFDVAVTEEHAAEAEVTENPVEKGIAITEGYRRRPRRLSLEVVVSDTPFGDIAAIREASAQNRRAAASALGVGLLYRPVKPSEEVRAKLETLLDKGEPVVVVTEIRTYDSMWLTSVSEPREADTGDAASLRLEFSEARVITNERTTVQVAVPRNAKKRNLGHQTGADAAKTTPPPPKAVKNQFTLARDRSTLDEYFPNITRGLPGGT